jgi:hypothetical protein
MKLQIVILFFVLGATCRSSHSAGDAATASTNAPGPASKDTVQKSFDSLRDPFWPVNWQPAEFGRPQGKPQVGPSVALKWAEATKLLQVTALSRSPKGQYIAIVKNVGVVEEGDVISIHYGNAVYKWTVRGITAAGIETEKLGVYPLTP